MQEYMEQHWTSYFIANKFFPWDIRNDVFALYAFVRIPDDIVDQPQVDQVVARQKLIRYKEMFDDIYNWNVVIKTKNSQWEQVITETVMVFKKYDIPQIRAHDFLDAMFDDLQKKVYMSYSWLQKYMYWSAEVVGLMMCKIIWYKQSQEQEVFRTAKLLGEAMQYTNFLRDIVEDNRDYDRLYIPEDRLLSHDLNHVLLTQYILWKKVDSQRQKFMSQQVLFCKELYREANTWINLLDKKWRKAVRIASWIYESILDKIIRLNYDVFSQDAHTTKREKLTTLFFKSFLYAIGKTN